MVIINRRFDPYSCTKLGDIAKSIFFFFWVDLATDDNTHGNKISLQTVCMKVYSSLRNSASGCLAFSVLQLLCSSTVLLRSWFPFSKQTARSHQEHLLGKVLTFQCLRLFWMWCAICQTQPPHLWVWISCANLFTWILCSLSDAMFASSSSSFFESRSVRPSREKDRKTAQRQELAELSMNWSVKDDFQRSQLL